VIVRLLLVACSLALLLGGCTGDGDGSAADTPSETASAGQTSSSAEEPAPQKPEPPKEGSCYRLTLEEAARPTNDERPVQCSGSHTARTIHVGRLDTGVDGHALGVDSDRVQEQLARTCPAQLAEFLGGDPQARALSRFQAIWFSPTLEEYDAGADWFRCDVVAVAGPDRLLQLPSDDRLRGILDRPGTLDTYGLCGTAQPGAPGFERVACSLGHSWVAISTIPIAGGDRYPGVATVREAGDETCSDEVRGRNDFALEYRYGWEWPTDDQWVAGQHYGFCWAPKDLA
jgi:Septum formation